MNRPDVNRLEAWILRRAVKILDEKEWFIDGEDKMPITRGQILMVADIIERG